MTRIRQFEILVAEDSPQDAELVREALKEHSVDCKLHLARDGARAIAFLDALESDSAAPPLDLVLVDMHLPMFGGDEILKRLRSTERYGQTPVIVMSGIRSPFGEETALRNAAQFYFTKPSTLEGFMELGSIVRSILEKSRRDSA